MYVLRLVTQVPEARQCRCQLFSPSESPDLSPRPKRLPLLDRSLEAVDGGFDPLGHFASEVAHVLLDSLFEIVPKASRLHLHQIDGLAPRVAQDEGVPDGTG